VDVFIIVKQGRLWVTRLLVTLVLSLFRLRRHREDVANKICLSFYLTDQSLDLSRIALFPDDVYLMYWLDELIPLYDPKDMYARVRQENAWVKKFVPDALQSHDVLHRWKVKDTWLVHIVRGIWSLFLLSVWGDAVERLAKKMQQWKMNKNTKSVQHAPDTRVVVSDEMLKFHENDRRAYYRDEWKKKLKNYGIEELKNSIIP
jgi:hypothetical protein